VTLNCDHIDDLSLVARRIIEWLGGPTVVLFDGEMGAGKTTLISAICREMNIVDEVSSPTFSLVNEYHSVEGDSIFHFDLYRIEHEDEALDIGIEEYFDSNQFCFVEWPDRIPNLLPQKFSRVDIKVDDGKRIFSLS
jgi:tRNA threonylcarbamoyladenosine biosynthesis protein TsaE